MLGFLKSQDIFFTKKIMLYEVFFIIFTFWNLVVRIASL